MPQKAEQPGLSTMILRDFQRIHLANDGYASIRADRGFAQLVYVWSGGVEFTTIVGNGAQASAGDVVIVPPEAACQISVLSAHGAAQIMRAVIGPTDALKCKDIDVIERDEEDLPPNVWRRISRGKTSCSVRTELACFDAFVDSGRKISLTSFSGSAGWLYAIMGTGRVGSRSFNGGDMLSIEMGTPPLACESDCAFLWFR